MTDLEYYRMKRLMHQLRRLDEEYPMRTLDNIIRSLDSRLAFHRELKLNKQRNKKR